MSVIDRQTDAKQGVAYLRAYLECSDAVREVVHQMVQIVADPETESDDQDMALSTLADALFPARWKLHRQRE